MRGLTLGLCVLLVAGCGDDGGVGAGESTSTGAGTDGPSTSSMSSSMSTSSLTGTESSGDSGTTDISGESTFGTDSTGPGTESSGGTTGGTDSGSTTMPTSSSSGGDTGMLLGNGEQCTDNDECASGNCYLAGILGGICGECLTDDDCVWGCAVPNPLAMPPEGSTCDDGTLGAGCETDAACQGALVCTEVVDVPGILTVGGCSECATDADCAELCSPNYDTVFTEFEGHWACVDIGSQPLGAGCDFAGSGDQACASGFCGIASIMGLLELGICSDCVDDGDCPMGTVCEAPTVDLDGTVTPGSCV
jgi:hypothetical protein